jgi:hypothetical protein
MLMPDIKAPTGGWLPPYIENALRPARPLNWREPTDHPQDGFGAEDIVSIAPGIGGRYSISREKDGTFLLWMAHDEFIWQSFSSVENAKDAAERDWQSRVLLIVREEFRRSPSQSTGGGDGR